MPSSPASVPLGARPARIASIASRSAGPLARSAFRLANELVDPAALRWISGELDADPGFRFVCYVD
ncbi:hypothetical protein ABZ590_38300, partial [Streptomyces hirsutus]|uniref:hypothetical protein n=1 Tax=Streptomyces hirsutus TaxID=35620 RepID=UPI0033F669FE